jgi:hypothetical protein
MGSEMKTVFVVAWCDRGTVEAEADDSLHWFELENMATPMLSYVFETLSDADEERLKAEAHDDWADAWSDDAAVPKTEWRLTENEPLYPTSRVVQSWKWTMYVKGEVEPRVMLVIQKTRVGFWIDNNERDGMGNRLDGLGEIKRR